MKHALALLAVAAAVALGVDMLGDATQTRPDEDLTGTRSEIVMNVRSTFRRRLGPLAAGLWGACQGTVASRLVAPGVTNVRGGRFRFEVEPGLGTHARGRLTGCLEDTTLDRVQADVRWVRLLPGAAPSGVQD